MRIKEWSEGKLIIYQEKTRANTIIHKKTRKVHNSEPEIFINIMRLKQ